MTTLESNGAGVEDERMRRPVLERAAPDRSWPGAFRAARPPSQAEHEPASSTPPSPSAYREAAYDSINDAYRMIDEYLRQGQQIAERVWLPLVEGNSPMPVLNMALERLLRAVGDMGVAWTEVVQNWGGANEQRPAPSAPGPFTAGKAVAPSGSNAAAPSAPARTASVLSVAIESSRRVEATIELLPGASPAGLTASPLLSIDRDIPPIREVSIEAVEDRSQLRVRIEVPDEQPAGVYNGMLLDLAAQRPCGTITVQVR